MMFLVFNLLIKKIVCWVRWCNKCTQVNRKIGGKCYNRHCHSNDRLPIFFLLNLCGGIFLRIYLAKLKHCPDGSIMWDQIALLTKGSEQYGLVIEYSPRDQLKGKRVHIVTMDTSETLDNDSSSTKMAWLKGSMLSWTTLTKVVITNHHPWYTISLWISNYMHTVTYTYTQ